MLIATAVSPWLTDRARAESATNKHNCNVATWMDIATDIVAGSRPADIY